MFYYILLVFSILFLLIYIFPIVIVDGESMEPALHDGDILIGIRIFFFLRKFLIKSGKVYMFMPPSSPSFSDEITWNIKRLSHSVYRLSGIPSICYFYGDNKDNSWDSRNYGGVSVDNVKVRILFRIHEGG